MGPAGCACPWAWQPGDDVINADSAEHLAEYLEEQAER
jgi:alkyl hydroperoxide reductase subunit AhpC